MYDTSVIDYYKKYQRIAIGIGLMLLCIIAGLCILSTPVSAKSTFNSTLNFTSATENSITWHYIYLTANRPIGASLDGVDIEGWKSDYVYNYTAVNLEPNTAHEFCIFGSTTSNCEIGNTTSSNNRAIEVYDIIYQYIFLIIGIILLFIGIVIKRKELFLAAGLSAFIGLGIVGENLLPKLIYILFIIVAWYISFED